MKEKPPRELRRAVLEEVLSHAGADAVWFFSLAEIDGAPVISDWQTVGDPTAGKILHTIWREPRLLPESLLERIRHPGHLQTRSFCEGATTPWTEILRDTELYRRVLAPAGFVDMARLLIYEEDRFVGMVAGVRFGEGRARFSRNDRRRLTPHIESIASALVAADEALRKDLPASAGSCLIVRPDGEVEYASAGGNDWLTREEFSDALREWIQEVNTEGPGEMMRVLRQAEVRLTRLDGGGSLRYLVRLARATPMRHATNSPLSPVQRQVATYAASGATVQQIAETLNRAPETVRSHLREAYARLGVSNRIELARIIDATGSSGLPN